MGERTLLEQWAEHAVASTSMCLMDPSHGVSHSYGHVPRAQLMRTGRSIRRLTQLRTDLSNSVSRGLETLARKNATLNFSLRGAECCVQMLASTKYHQRMYVTLRSVFEGFKASRCYIPARRGLKVINRHDADFAIRFARSFATALQPENTVAVLALRNNKSPVHSPQQRVCVCVTLLRCCHV